MNTPLDQALKLADQACPLPSLAGPALKLLRERVRELECQQAARVPAWPKFVQDECLQVLRNMDTELGATGRKSARIERLINAIAGMPAAPVGVPATTHRERVCLRFPELGDCGPFAVVNGYVSIPDATFADIIQHCRKRLPVGVPEPLPIDAAPRDGTMLRLLVRFTEHATDDSEEAWTIGSNSFDANGEDAWQFAGWCWTHDHFTEGKGTPIGWLPMLAAAPSAPVGVPDGYFVAPLLKPDEMQALRRFAETTEDDESYDVPKDMMAFLSINGAVSRSATKKDWFWLTDYGRMLLAAAPSAPQADA